MKLCRQCNQEKELSAFRFVKAKNNYCSPCKSCRYAKTREWAQRNPDKIRTNRRRFNANNPEKNRARVKRWLQANPEKARAYRKRYSAEKREIVREYKRRWKERNPDKRNAARVHYLASKINATPSWLSSEQKFRIGFFYTLAKFFTWLTGIKFEVDHVEPLRGKDICGLHVPWNLQILPAEINNLKGNRRSHAAC